MRNGSTSSGGIFDIESQRERLTALEAQMAEPTFWDHQERAQAVVQQVKVYKQWVEPFDTLVRGVSDAREMAELLTLVPDATTRAAAL